MGRESEDILGPGGFGAILARAGVGKTALTVQIALNSLLRSQNVLHISLNDPVDKVTLWYKEVFSLIAQQYNVSQAQELWNTLLPHRFIMTFQVEGFSVPKLEERLNDITQQDIFKPHVVIIDGLPFNRDTAESLTALKELAQKHAMHIWFTVTTHRHEHPDAEGIPVQIKDTSDLFDVIIQLQPDGKSIHIKALKSNSEADEAPSLVLDPSTMMIQKKK
jgi:KaiC/GvpD/RAD55 family RecA-like ATPase